MSLATCPACKRLVREREATCPFCKAARTPGADAPGRTKMGRLSRSALLVSAAVVLGNPVDSCKRILGFNTGTEAAYGGPPPPLAVYGGPPPVPTVVVPTLDAGSEDAAADASATPTAPDAGVRPPPKPDAGVRMLPKPAYGGPPPRR